MSEERSHEQYPAALSAVEEQLLRARRESRGETFDPASALGVGISGGGVRSATFALGFFQSLARGRCLKNIDYMSTVSGGGYFGGFFGALFRRAEVQRLEDVEATLEARQRPEVLRYLRENGSYLAPAGTDSLLLAAATLFRNWLVVQLVLLTTLFTVLLGLQVSSAWVGSNARVQDAIASFPLWQEAVALSPFWCVFAAMTVFWAIPLTWSYWTIGRDVPGYLPNILRALAKLVWTPLLFAFVIGSGLWITGTHPVAGMIVAGVGALALATGLIAMMLPAQWAPRFAACGAIVATLAHVLGWSAAIWVGVPGAVCAALLVAVLFRELRRNDQKQRGAPDLDQDNDGRYELSAALKTALVSSAAVFALAAIDSAARWAYDVIDRELAGELTAVGALLAAASAGLRRAWALFGARPGKQERPSLSIAVLARIAALLLVVGLVFMMDLAAYAVVAHSWSLAPWILSGAAGFCLLLGSSRNLLNASTHLPLYSARIIRAYLGASNAKRTGAVSQPVAANDQMRAAPAKHASVPSPAAATRVMPDDDMTAEQYWCWQTGERVSSEPYRKGAPIHLVNVTINETVDGRSQIQQGDRKGVGLAVGPGGFSVGVRHHVVFQGGQRHALPQGSGWRVFRFQDDAASDARVWSKLSPVHWLDRQHKKKNFPFDQLSFGQWLGISGAAFSTGLGSRTNLGLSLLAALANVRLGFWWRPGVQTAVPFLHLLGALFWVQTYLFRELLARFPGTSRTLWYLSDGGHFENLGGYELIRRRLPYVLLIDAEQDEAYGCEGLANLVRKARLDFGAEIEFFEQPELGFELPGKWPAFLGPIEALRRGTWSEDTLADARLEGSSRAHAALARIRYRDAPEGFLLYVKPTLVGEEPEDLRHYHLAHPAFPHEPTSDQFFDEAQWESYRRLGELIGERLLQNDGVLRRFFERRFTDQSRYGGVSRSGTSSAIAESSAPAAKSV